MDHRRWLVTLALILAAAAPSRAVEDPEPTLDITGVVVGIGAGPLEAVSVVAVAPEGVSLPHGVHPAALTNVDGRFAILDLPRAKYELTVTRQSGVLEELDLFDDFDEPLRIELDVGGVIRGTVRTTDEGGIPGLRVFARPASGEGAHSASAASAVDGSFAIMDLDREQTYDLRTDRPRAVRPSIRMLPAGVLAGVQPDGDPIEIDVAAGNVLAGVVQHADGTPIPRALVWATRRNSVDRSGVIRSVFAGVSARTDRFGRFCIVGVPDGRYRLGVSDIDGRPVTVAARGAEDAVAGERDLEVVVDIAGEIAGTVVDEDGVPLIATLWATPSGPDTPARQVPSDESGAFRMTGLDARWSYRIIAYRAGRVPVVLDAVRVGTRDHRVVLRTGLAVTGRIEYEDGRPVPRIPLSVESLGVDGVRGMVSQEGETDEDGRFRVTGLPEGPIRVSTSLARSDKRTRTVGSVDADAGDDVVIVVRVTRY